MTTTDHPAWCTSENCTDKQHWRFVKLPDHVPANGSLAKSSYPDEFREVPKVAAHLRWYENFGRGVEVVVHEHNEDVEWVFSLENAFELLTQILDAFVTAADGLSEVPMPVFDAQRHFEALRKRLVERIAADRAEQLRELEVRAIRTKAV